MITKSEINEAIETGHKASQILSDVISEIGQDIYCPDADGFEGRETFPDCGELLFV